MTTKPVNQKAWLLVLPVLLCVAFSAILPLMTVVNYSVQDIISPERRVFVGTEWFASVMRDEELHAALLRQLTFSLAVLAVEIPLGIDYSYTGNARHAWITVLAMDVWHWTPLVALLCFAGLRSIPDAYYQAARIDGASRLAVFRYIQLPKMRGVLMIAVLLRFMDKIGRAHV